MAPKQSRELSPELQEIADYHVNQIEEAAAEGAKKINDICDAANKALDDLQRKMDKWWVDAVDKHRVHSDVLIANGEWKNYTDIIADVYGNPEKFRKTITLGSLNPQEQNGLD